MTGVIEAAGGVIWRMSDKGHVEVLAVHRPDRDDWSLPKGKLDPGETAVGAAVREVEEETGFRCRVGPELAEARYRHRKGRAKRVRYWAMQVEDGSFRRNDEVDEVRWIRLDRAPDLLTYPHDLLVLASLTTVLAEVTT